MNTNNADKSSSWKNWIIKKLLSNDSTKEDILNFIANDEDNKDIENLNDNNEKNLIKNIVNLNEKSVEDLMIPRSEIVALDHDKSYNEILEVIKEDEIFITSGNVGLIRVETNCSPEKVLGLNGEIGRKKLF